MIGNWAEMKGIDSRLDSNLLNLRNSLQGVRIFWYFGGGREVVGMANIIKDTGRKGGLDKFERKLGVNDYSK